MIGTTLDTATSALLTECITDAENEVKKQLSERYDLTQFTTTTSCPILGTLARDLTIGYAYEAMSRGSKEGMARADRYIMRVMENLKQIREGEVQLFDGNGILITELEGKWKVRSNIVEGGYSPTFNEDDAKNWRNT